ncbi:hypothetical protein ACL598_12580 [Bordetella bronchialis]|uniref:hypothetical protein n=1 Tax=Bordetella bronchialis TaxID=463025 RepID=UPI003D058659
MSGFDELRIAMMRWQQAHSAVMDFFERNDILDPAMYASWMELRNAEDDARMEAEDMMEALRAEDDGA